MLWFKHGIVREYTAITTDKSHRRRAGPDKDIRNDLDLTAFIGGIDGAKIRISGRAARIDGARFWQRLWFIVIPSLRPIIEFVAVVTTVGLLTNMFGLVYVLTGGGPGTATTLPEFLIWLEQGKLNRPGYAAALSMFLFVMMAGVAYAQVRIMNRNAEV